MHQGIWERLVAGQHCRNWDFGRETTS